MERRLFSFNYVEQSWSVRSMHARLPCVRRSTSSWLPPSAPHTATFEPHRSPFGRVNARKRKAEIHCPGFFVHSSISVESTTKIYIICSSRVCCERSKNRINGFARPRCRSKLDSEVETKAFVDALVLALIFLRLGRRTTT